MRSGRDATALSSEHLPEIIVSSRDAERLRALAESYAQPPYAVLIGFLARELTRAQVRAPQEITPGIVTMRSRVRFRLDDESESREGTLVYPGDEDHRISRISVLSPIGSALIGLQEGDRIQWRSLDGRPLGLTVLKVLYQPEAHGRDLE